MNTYSYLQIIRNNRERLFRRALLQLDDAIIANQIISEIITISTKQMHDLHTETQVIILLYSLLLLRCQELADARNLSENNMVILREKKINLANCHTISDFNRVLIEKFNSLPLQTREILLLYYFDEVDLSEISIFSFIKRKQIQQFIKAAHDHIILLLIADGREEAYFLSPIAKEVLGIEASNPVDKSQQRLLLINTYLAKMFQALINELDMDKMDRSEKIVKLAEESNILKLDSEEKRLLNEIRWQRIFLYIKKNTLRHVLQLLSLGIIIYTMYFYYTELLLK